MGKFTIRDFDGVDVYRYEQLCATSFNQKNAAITNKDSFLKDICTEDELFKADVTENGNHTMRTGLYLDDRLIAAMKSIAYMVNFDSSECEMTGIAGVVTDPEMRKMGSITKLYSKMFENMKNRGQILSHLYPFSATFYRKYGYEMCITAVEWTIPVEYLPKTEFSGIIHYEDNEEQRNDIKDVYRSFSKKYNISVVRSDKKWKSFLDRRAPYASEFFSYLHYGADGADGYLTYTVTEHETEPMTFDIRNFYFSNVKSLKEMLAFLRTFDSYIKNVKITLPNNIDITYILDDLCGGFGKKDVERRVLSVGATRVVDAEKVLNFAKYNGKGDVSIKLTDRFCPWNNKCFHVEFDETCQRVSECDSYDVEMNINSFTALILGCHDISDHLYMGDVKIYKNKENLKKVFYKKPLWIEEHF